MNRFACAVCAILGVIFLTLALLPPRYVAVARVLLPQAHREIGPFVVKAATFDMSVSGEPGSRVLAIEHWDADPQAAADAVNAFLRARLADDMVVIDDAAVPFAPVGPGTAMRRVWGFLGLVCFAFVLWKSKKPLLPLPDRALVRHALRFARNGERTLLIDTGNKLRVVLSRDAARAVRPHLRILATLAGGALIVARLERQPVASPRRRALKTVANS